MHCFYALQPTATLFGEWALMAEWGRIGSAGRLQERVFRSRVLAQPAVVPARNRWRFRRAQERDLSARILKLAKVSGEFT
jgi:predicted DNA-binding WGR domain protein